MFRIFSSAEPGPQLIWTAMIWHPSHPRGSGHGRHSIYRSESGKPTAIKSVNGVFAPTLTIDQTLAAAKEQSRPSVAGEFGHELIRR